MCDFLVQTHAKKIALPRSNGIKPFILFIVGHESKIN